ncbi:MAG: transporter ATP-binding protein, partial [Arthrobacter sp.]|nr:transporter ATP-binding protein [Arthrobacter sp.]
MLITWGFITMAAEVLLRLLEPWPVKIVLDAVSHSLGATVRKTPFCVQASLELLLLCAGAVVAISVIRAIAGY